jgi:hypothetical protein
LRHHHCSLFDWHWVRNSNLLIKSSQPDLTHATALRDKNHVNFSVNPTHWLFPAGPTRVVTDLAFGFHTALLFSTLKYGNIVLVSNENQIGTEGFTVAFAAPPHSHVALLATFIVSRRTLMLPSR